MSSYDILKNQEIYNKLPRVSQETRQRQQHCKKSKKRENVVQVIEQRLVLFQTHPNRLQIYKQSE